MPPLRNTINSRKLLIRQRHRLKIRLNTSRIRALRKNHISPPQSPSNQHLRQRTALPLRNPIQRRVLRHPLPRGRDLVLGPQRRVGFHDDVVGLAVLDDFGVWEEGVDFDLVDVGFYLCGFGEGFEA